MRGTHLRCWITRGEHIVWLGFSFLLVLLSKRGVKVMAACSSGAMSGLDPLGV